ncbi:transcription factor MYC2-like [Lolium rigidum]|uniref:transcription factor MYC2-like n=1 Tax=Lolium rigidum TaxID=89674 RepID=UPI001F5D792F|nr:transcription factor MYC2-like [Lolium rigidum]
MDELLSPCSSIFPPSPPSQFSPADGPHHQVLEFASCEVPEQWLLDDIVLAPKSEDANYVWPAGSSTLSPASNLSEMPPCSLPASTSKRRGRKPGPRPEAPSVSHVEAERHRRDKLNRRFCDLRAAVPTVSRMDKASLLADAANYIAELRARVARLEEEGREAAATWEASSRSASSRGGYSLHRLAGDEAVEVRMVGRDAAALRVTTAGGAPHAPARLMSALRSLELQVQHACVSKVQGLTVQDVFVDVPAALQNDDGGGGALHSALLKMLRDSA